MLTQFEGLIMGMPEALGLMVFGFGLIAGAAILRTMLAKRDAIRAEEPIRK